MLRVSSRLAEAAAVPPRHPVEHPGSATIGRCLPATDHGGGHLRALRARRADERGGANRYAKLPPLLEQRPPRSAVPPLAPPLSLGAGACPLPAPSFPLGPYSRRLPPPSALGHLLAPCPLSRSLVRRPPVTCPPPQCQRGAFLRPLSAPCPCQPAGRGLLPSFTMGLMPACPPGFAVA